MQSVPKHLFKSTLILWKGIFKLKSISNINDIDIYFADPGTPSQRGLNENPRWFTKANGLQRS